MDLDDSTQMMIDLWAKHRAEKFDIPDDGDMDDMPDWKVSRLNDWERTDNAWRLLVGVRLANQAVEQWERMREKP